MIIFHNPGLIPLEALRLMGASVKQEGAFGRFGTGLKYAIATILRGGGQVTIWRGEQLLNFSLRPVEMAGQTFTEVLLVGAHNTSSGVIQTGEPLGFTTSLGKDWEPWMALRELACNARDEGGDFLVHAVPDTPNSFWGVGEQTMIVVDWPAMDAAAADGGAAVFAPNTEPLREERGVRVHAGRSDYLYHRGVRVWKLPRPSLFTYDIVSPVDLTEDRTVKYGFCVTADVRNMLLSTGDAGLIAATVTAGKETWEGGFDWEGKLYGAMAPGDAWLEQVAILRDQRNGLSKSAQDLFLGYTALHTSKQWGGSHYEETSGPFAEAADSLRELGVDVTHTNVFVAQELPGEALSTVRGGSVFVSEALLKGSRRQAAEQLLTRWLELQSAGDHDTLLALVVPLLLDTDWELKQERKEDAPAPAPRLPAPQPAPVPVSDDVPF